MQQQKRSKRTPPCVILPPVNETCNVSTATKTATARAAGTVWGCAKQHRSISSTHHSWCCVLSPPLNRSQLTKNESAKGPPCHPAQHLSSVSLTKKPHWGIAKLPQVANTHFAMRAAQNRSVAKNQACPKAGNNHCGAVGKTAAVSVSPHPLTDYIKD